MTIWNFQNVAGRRALDGDTVELVIDTGFKHTATIIVRLLGIVRGSGDPVSLNDALLAAKLAVRYSGGKKAIIL